MEPTRVGFIGLGIMGKPMAGHLLEAGYPLTVYNRTRSRTGELEARGAAVADSPGGVAAASEVIITMVSDSPDVKEVIAGSAGVLDRIRAGSVVVEMSTASPSLERDLDERLKGKGCRLVDAPVSGGDVGAREGTLAIMAGGERQAFERVRPLLEVLGSSITYCGTAGCGQLTKLCNQIVVSLNLLAVSEALVFARKNGLDPSVMVEAIRGGAAGSWQLTHLAPRIIQRDFTPGFMVKLLQKDLRLVFEAAREVPIPGTALVRQLFESAVASGEGELGTQVLGRVLERLAGVVVDS